ncbi:DNA cytosine methyltransferase [Amycolatopsis sp. A1MSW2902]
MKAGSLFTGTGALDMAAAEVFDAEPVWFADIDPAASALLAHRYPGVPNLRDITAVDWDLVALLAPIELLFAGWPCQPFSLAGKRKGAEDERALWPEVDRCIRALRPRYVLLENVPAVVGAELGRVADTLAACGYRFAWVCLPASAVGAPHKRERFFLLAVAEDADRAAGGERREPAPRQAESRRARADARGRGGASAADSAGEHERPVTAGARRRKPEEPAGNSATPAADTEYGSQPEWPRPTRRQARERASERRGPGCGCEDASDSDCGGRDGGTHNHRSRHATSERVSPTVVDWAGYTPAIRRWEAILGRPAPAPTVPGSRGGHVLNPALPEWMMGLPAGWITGVPGLSRAQQLKLAGNGVVWQQAAEAYRYLLGVLRDAAA